MKKLNTITHQQVPPIVRLLGENMKFISLTTFEENGLISISVKAEKKEFTEEIHIYDTGLISFKPLGSDQESSFKNFNQMPLINYLQKEGFLKSE